MSGLENQEDSIGVSMKIARVFPRKTAASPEDTLAFFGPPGDNIPFDIDEVHVSITFSYDILKANELAESWKHIAPIKIGGPAMGDPGGEFVPGMYLKPGYVFTSRGCPNNCWFCDVHKREGNIRELPITQGNNIADSNIFACSIEHVRKVFAMLKNQKSSVAFTGGLEAKRLTLEHVFLLWDIRPKQMFFAYDAPDDLEPLIKAGELLRFANFTRGHLNCYVLIGYPKDTIDNARKRLLDTWQAGFMPFAMLWKNKAGDVSPEWRRFSRVWSRPAITKAHIKQMFNEFIL